LHDIISRILSTYKEKPGFGFQETVFRSLEALVSLQLCDSDTEHQVVSSICDLVEGSAAEIHSGWQSVFGALRAVKQVSKDTTDRKQDRSNGIQDAVLEVVAAVLNHRDPAVFSQAAIPCVQCLIKLLSNELVVIPQNKGSHSQLSEFDLGVGNSSDRSEEELSEGNNDEQTSFSLILENLNQCSMALSTVFSMRVRPFFRGSEQICLPGDELIGGELVSAFDAENSGILIVWALLVNSLTETTPKCEGSLLNQVTSLLFKLLQALINCPGLPFFAHILTSVVIPVLNSWVVSDTWNHKTASSFSHVVGQTVDLVAEHLPNLGVSEDKIVIKVVPKLIEKVVELAGTLILKEDEKIARVGCSTFRLLASCCHNNLRGLLLHTVCCGLAKALDNSLEPVKSLIDQYDPGDQNLKGKENSVKLVSRKNAPETVVRRSLHLAEQLFISTATTASSRRKQVRLNVADPMSEKLSHALTFVFSNDNSIKKRISFRQLVVSLVSHRLLLQVIQDLLFPVAPLKESKTKSERTCDSSECVAEFSEISCLIDCIMNSCITAAAFDSRPALQVTVSKLAVMEPVLASLAKQAETGTAIVMLVVQEAARLRMNSSDQSQMQEVRQNNESMSDLQYSASGPVIKDLLSNMAPYLGQLCQVIFHQLIQLQQAIPSADTSQDNVNFGSLLPGWVQATGKIIDCINSLPSPVFQVVLGEVYAPMTDVMAVLQDENVRQKVKSFFVKVGLLYHIC
jgi:brefeldin A-inhibited guanine nucleotide-exchange protein 3